jgi:hypothetical protein
MEKVMALGICLLGLIPKRFLALGNNSQQYPISCLRSGLDVSMNHLSSRTDLGEPNQLQHVAAREPS